MCFRYLRRFACGHVGYVDAYCNKISPSGFTEVSECEDFTEHSSTTADLCGTEGYFCAHTLSGQRHEYVYKGIVSVEQLHDYCEVHIRHIEQDQADIGLLRRLANTTNPDHEVEATGQTIQTTFYIVYNFKRHLEWFLGQLYTKYDLGRQYFQTTLPSVPVGETIPELEYPPDEPQPDRIDPSLAGTPTHNAPGINHYSSLRQSVRQRALSLGGSLSDDHGSTVPPGSRFPGAHLVQFPAIANLQLDQSTGDRSEAIGRMVQGNVKRLHRQQELESGYAINPSTPVRARRVMSRNDEDDNTIPSTTILPVVRRLKNAPAPIFDRRQPTQMSSTPTPASRRSHRVGRVDYSRMFASEDKWIPINIDVGQHRSQSSLLVKLPVQTHRNMSGMLDAELMPPPPAPLAVSPSYANRLPATGRLQSFDTGEMPSTKIKREVETDDDLGTHAKRARYDLTY